ncbi:MAG: GGDEF domain-containing protein [Solirubrobacteraceae bacterium]|nr:GGDEF domain-containing protein [Solirubrobacteraceae bacterium]
MRYTEPKDRSAELLRVTLGHMGRHAAAFNPVTFTLWYEYAAGINPPLHAAIEQLLRDQVNLGDELVAQLYEAHVVPTDAAAVQKVGGELQKVMRGIAASAAHTGERAGLFGAQLDDLSLALRSNDVATLTPQLDEARAGTAEMRHSADALQQQVSAGQNEIARLRTDLDRARGEALIDPLTGILNRKGFDQRIAALLQEAPAGSDAHCLVLLDIDHFKKVNDAHGHVMGDRVLQGIGEILRQSVAGSPHAVARYGGEEFAIVLAHSRVADAQRLAEQVRQRAKAMKIRNRNTQEVLFTVTLSGGVTALCAGDDAQTLVARADAALYESKHGGRDRVSCA